MYIDIMHTFNIYIYIYIYIYDIYKYIHIHIKVNYAINRIHEKVSDQTCLHK